MPPSTMSARELVDEVRTQRDAIVQLEHDVRSQQQAIERRVQRALQHVRETSWDGAGKYRGVFDSEDEARSFGLLMLSRRADPREAERATKMLQKEMPSATRAMDSVSDGALIPTEFSSRLKRLVEAYGAFVRNAFRMPMNSDTLTFLKQTGELTVFLVGENQAGGTSDPKFANVTLNAREWGTLTYVPRTLEEDSAPEVGELIARSVAHAFAKKADDIGFKGDATSTYFGIQGVIPKLQSIDGGAAGLVEGSGSSWSDLTLHDFEAAAGTLPEFAGRMEPKWYCSRKFYWTVMVKLQLAAGGVTASEIEGRRERIFMGDPVEFVQSMPRSSAADQVPCLYGDLREAATIGDRRQLSVEESRDYKFAERQMTYLGTERIAISVEDVGNSENAGPIVGLKTQSG